MTSRFALLALASSCVIITDEEYADRMDLDRDGVLATVDCDDQDPVVGGPTTWLLDADGDGFGDDGAAAEACDAPARYVADGGDCDDASAAIYPGAEETCDGADGDCDGAVDEEAVDLEIFWVDGDGDGYGLAGDAVEACALPDGASELDTDCDDDDPNIHPGAEEICDDLVDNDCDGAPAPGCLLEGTYTADQTDAVILGVEAGSQVGYHVAIGWDLDGDGVGEVLVGAPDTGILEGRTEPGSVYLFPADRLAAFQNIEGAPTRYTGVEQADWFGASFDGGADFDGGGAADLLVGAPGLSDGLVGYREDAGGAFLFSPEHSASTSAEDALLGVSLDEEDGHGGISVALTDVNGDGLAEVIVGAPGEVDLASGPGSNTPPGSVYVYVGGAVSGVVSAADADLVIEGPEGGGWLGLAIEAPGDGDGDGYNDLAVGAPGANHQEGQGAGAIYLLHGGSAEGVVDAEEATGVLLGTQVGEGAGLSLASGDFDDDGALDLAVGAPTIVGSGWAYVVPGAFEQAGERRLSAEGIHRLDGNTSGSSTGWSLAAGNFDGFSGDDLFVGAPTHDDAAAGEDAGLAYLLYGPIQASTSLASAPVFLLGGSARDKLGWSAAFGDLDGDGFDDAVVGAYEVGSGVDLGSGVGGAYVIFGRGL